MVTAHPNRIRFPMNNGDDGHEAQASMSMTDQERMIGMEFIRATEATAPARYKWMGKGDKESGDFAACDAIRGLFDTVAHSRRRSRSAKGSRTTRPGIFKGEKLGTWSRRLDARWRSRSIRSTARRSSAKVCPARSASSRPPPCENRDDDPMTLLADIPSFYMNKISFGPRVKHGPGRIRLDNSVQDNLEIIALKLGKRVQDLTVVILDRPRHERLIHDVRRAGAAIRLISDGDIAAAIAPSLPGSGVDVYMGTGGSPEAVLAAAGIKCLGGEILAQMWPRDDAEREHLSKTTASARRSCHASTPPTIWPKATASSSPRPASAIRRCSRASATKTPPPSPQHPDACEVSDDPLHPDRAQPGYEDDSAAQRCAGAFVVILSRSHNENKRSSGSSGASFV